MKTLDKKSLKVKDLGVKIGSKEEAAWTEVQEAQEKSLLNSRINVEVAEHMLELTKKKIAEEKEKLK